MTGMRVHAGELAAYVTEELNVAQLETAHPDEYGSTQAVPNFKALGVRLGRRMAPVAAAVKALSPQQIAQFQARGTIDVAGETLSADEVRLPPPPHPPHPAHPAHEQQSLTRATLEWHLHPFDARRHACAGMHCAEVASAPVRRKAACMRWHALR
jgi:hypothetical protein